MKEIVDEINPLIPEILANKSILKGFKSFPNKYLHFKIKREEITQIMCGEGIYILKIEYFTSVIPFSKDIKFHQSANYYSSGSDPMHSGKEPLDKTIVESQNVETDENTTVLDYTDRLMNEKEFLKRIVGPNQNSKKIVIQNKYFVENAFSSLIRYVAVSSNFIFYLLIFFSFHTRWNINPKNKTFRGRRRH